MARLTPSAGAVPLLAGIAAATVLSGAAVLTVAQSGCDDPGTYRKHDGVVELIGGCIQPDDLPITPQEGSRVSRPLGSADDAARSLHKPSPATLP